MPCIIHDHCPSQTVISYDFAHSSHPPKWHVNEHFKPNQWQWKFEKRSRYKFKAAVPADKLCMKFCDLMWVDKLVVQCYYPVFIPTGRISRYHEYQDNTIMISQERLELFQPNSVHRRKTSFSAICDAHCYFRRSYTWRRTSAWLRIFTAQRHASAVYAVVVCLHCLAPGCLSDTSRCFTETAKQYHTIAQEV